MARYPTPAQVISDQTTNGQQKDNFSSWLLSSRQLPGANPPETYLLTPQGIENSAQLTPRVADCLLDLPDGTTEASLGLALTTEMMPGNYINLMLARPDINVVVKNLASGLDGRFRTLSGGDVPLSSTYAVPFQLVDGVWTQRMTVPHDDTKLDISVYEAYNTLSTEERDTGKKWIDGRTIYGKYVNFGSLPGNSTKTVPHGIASLDLGTIRSEGYAYGTTGSSVAHSFPVGITFPQSENFQRYYVDPVYIQVASTIASWTVFSCFFYLEYCKTV